MLIRVDGELAITSWFIGKENLNRSVCYWKFEIKTVLLSILALHYPYVLAFEPTFVEVRHVETGAMTQIIQGNNLRCIFSEAPPSTMHTKVNYGNNFPGGYPLQYGFDPRSSVYSDRSSSMSHSSSRSLYGGHPGNQVYSPRMQPSQGRREIIMASDDRIMLVQLASPSPSQ